MDKNPGSLYLSNFSKRKFSLLHSLCLLHGIGKIHSLLYEFDKKDISLYIKMCKEGRLEEVLY